MSGRGPTGDDSNPIVEFYRLVFGIGYDRNIGGIERTVRYVAGAVAILAGIGLVVFPVLGPTLVTILALALGICGLYLLYEARVQYCPLNHTIGRSTHSNN